MAARLKERRDVVVRRLIHRDGWLCWLCDEPLDPSIQDRAHPRFVTLDHLKPRSDGGRNSIGNLRLAHFACNQRRGTKRLDVKCLHGRVRCETCGEERSFDCFRKADKS